MSASLAYCRPSLNLRQPQVWARSGAHPVSFVVTDLEISPEARALVDSIADGLAAVLAYRRERAARDAVTAEDQDSRAVEQLSEAA